MISVAIQWAHWYRYCTKYPTEGKKAGYSLRSVVYHMVVFLLFVGFFLLPAPLAHAKDLCNRILSKISHLGGETYKGVIYPFWFSHHVLNWYFYRRPETQRANFERKGIRGGRPAIPPQDFRHFLRERMKKDEWAIAIWVVLVAMAHGGESTEADSLISRTQAFDQANLKGPYLFINGAAPGSKNHKSAKALFDRYFAARGVTYVEASTFAEYWKKNGEQVEKRGPIGKRHVYGHGRPGFVVVIDGRGAERLRAEGYARIIAPGGTDHFYWVGGMSVRGTLVRYNTCDFFEYGKHCEIAKHHTETVMPKGGTIYGLPKGSRGRPLSPLATDFTKFVFPSAVVRSILQNGENPFARAADPIGMTYPDTHKKITAAPKVQALSKKGALKYYRGKHVLEIEVSERGGRSVHHFYGEDAKEVLAYLRGSSVKLISSGTKLKP